MKLIKDFENYAIYPNGTVVNVTTGHIKKPTSNHSGRGYYYVDLYNNGIKQRFYIHRLVALYYIDNPLNKPFVNHIDGNPKNNDVDNLEWCTSLENVEHAAKTLHTMNCYDLHNSKIKKSIIGTYVKSGKTTKVYQSIREAERDTGIFSSNIVANLKGRQSHTKGIKWCYVGEV
ncbi:MAG: HNH endonuclease [Eubacterium sp.]|nr:HNH endonuclease [Eubacterium sp.]